MRHAKFEQVALGVLSAGVLLAVAACNGEDSRSDPSRSLAAAHVTIASDGDLQLDGRWCDLQTLGIEASRRTVSEHLARVTAGRMRLLDPSNPHGPAMCDASVRIEISPSARYGAFAWVVAEFERQRFAGVELATSGGVPEPITIAFDPSIGMNVDRAATGGGPATLRIDLGEFATDDESGRWGEWSVSEGSDDEHSVSARGLDREGLFELIRRRRPAAGELVATVALAPDALWGDVAPIVRDALALEPDFFSVNPPRER